MIRHLDIPLIKFALETLTNCSPDARLLTLKNLCQNNGIWTVPDDPDRYNPVLYEIEAVGVPATADQPEDLPRCWMKAASNILKAVALDQAA